MRELNDTTKERVWSNSTARSALLAPTKPTITAPQATVTELDLAPCPGILDEDGFPVQPMEVMFTDTGAAHDGQSDNVIPFEGMRAAGANEVTPDRRCSE